MAKKDNIVIQEVPKSSPQEWVARLMALVKAIDEMTDRDERRAALTYAKQRFGADWPSDSSY